jgi:hypothetical protein
MRARQRPNAFDGLDGPNHCPLLFFRSPIIEAVDFRHGPLHGTIVGKACVFCVVSQGERSDNELAPIRPSNYSQWQSGPFHSMPRSTNAGPPRTAKRQHPRAFEPEL